MKTEYNIPQSLPKEDRFLLAKAVDQYELSKHRKVGTSTSFLDEREFLLVTNFLNHKNINYNVVEMHRLCCKKIVSFGENHIPFLCYSFINKEGKIAHRDILGSLFALGLERDSIGDIFVEGEVCYFTVLKKVSFVIENDLRKIGSVTCNLKVVEEMHLTEVHEVVTTISLSSLRLDSIIGKLIPCSRNQAVDILLDKKVLVNYQISTNKNFQLQAGDILSIRTVGKFRIGSVLGNTKKGRNILEIIQYQ